VGYESTDDLCAADDFSNELRRCQMVEMEVRQDQRMGWLWECCFCLVSGGRMALRKELAEYNELGRDLDL